MRRRKILTVIAASCISGAAPLRAVDIHEAMHEIVDYQREMEAVFKRHEEIYIDSDILWHLVIAKGVPPECISRHPDIVKLGRGYWYSVALGELGGPGDYGRENCRNFLNPTNPRNLYGGLGILRRSQDYLMGERDYYLAHPPAEEMAYMRQGMNRWRTHVLQYGQQLRQYLDLFAQYRKESAYTAALCGEKKPAIERKYANRYEDRGADARFKQEMAELEKWCTEENAKAEATKARLKELHAGMMGMTNAFMFQDLQERYGKRQNALRLNQEYLDLLAKLEGGKPTRQERKNAEEKLAALRKRFGQMAEAMEGQFGPNWRDAYRDPKTRKLPGGLLEDDPATKLKIFANQEYGKNYQVGGDGQSAGEEAKIDLFKDDPYLRGEYPGAPPKESVLDGIDADHEKPRTPTQVGQDVREAAKAGVVEGKVSELERDAAAAMGAVMSDARTPEEVAAAVEANKRFQQDTTAPEREAAAERDRAVRMQDARVAAAEEVRKERLASADKASLEKRRSEALREMQGYNDSLDKKLKAEGRTKLTPEEQAEYERRATRYSELMEPTAEEAAAVEQHQGVRAEVNQALGKLAGQMGGTSEEEIAARAQNAAEADAATRTWRNLTFAGKMAGQVKDDIVKQRELGIAANNRVIAAEAYLKRDDLTPEQRAVAKQYLARAIQARGHAAEAILYDGATVVAGAAADVGTLGVGGTASRGVGKLLGRAEAEAAAHGSAAATTTRTANPQAAAQGAAAAEDLAKTQMLPAGGRAAGQEAGSATTRIMSPGEAAAAAEDLAKTQMLPAGGRAAGQEAGSATTRIMSPGEAAAAAEDLAKTQMLPAGGRAAGQEAASATTRMVGPQAPAQGSQAGARVAEAEQAAKEAVPSRPVSKMTQGEKQAHSDAAGEAAVRDAMKFSREGPPQAVDDMWKAAEGGSSTVLPSPTGGPTGLPVGELSRNLSQQEIANLFKPGANLTRQQIMQKADLLLARRKAAAAAAAEDLTKTQMTPPGKGPAGQ